MINYSGDWAVMHHSRRGRCRFRDTTTCVVSESLGGREESRIEQNISFLSFILLLNLLFTINKTLLWAFSALKTIWLNGDLLFVHQNNGMRLYYIINSVIIVKVLTAALI